MLEGSLIGCDFVGSLLSPEMFLTKICMVSSASAEEAREKEEEIEEMLLDRILSVVLMLLCDTRE